MTFIPAYKPGQQFDSRWREEPPERMEEMVEPHQLATVDLDTEELWAVVLGQTTSIHYRRALGKFYIALDELEEYDEDEPSPECEGGCGPRCACAYDRRDKCEDDR